MRARILIPAMSQLSDDSDSDRWELWQKEYGAAPTWKRQAPPPEDEPLDALSWISPGASRCRASRKLIFLDVDGVLNTSGDGEPDATGIIRDDVWPCTLSLPHLRILKAVLDQTGADIVLSSNWRLVPLGCRVLERGLRAVHISCERIVGATPDLRPHGSRQEEIVMWLRQNCSSSMWPAWVAIDDLPLEREQPTAMHGHCVLTSIASGFDYDAAHACVLLLNAGRAPEGELMEEKLSSGRGACGSFRLPRKPLARMTRRRRSLRLMQKILSIDACTAAVGKVVANEMCDNEYMAAVHGVEKEEVDENRAMMHLRHEAPTPAVSLAPHGLGPAECLCDVCMMIWPKQADADRIKRASKRQCILAGGCKKCGWPRQSIASWRKLCTCHAAIC